MASSVEAWAATGSPALVASSTTARSSSSVKVGVDGSPGLRAIRRYYGAHRRLILSAINYHPEGYRYTSWLARQAGDDPLQA